MASPASCMGEVAMEAAAASCAVSKEVWKVGGHDRACWTLSDRTVGCEVEKALVHATSRSWGVMGRAPFERRRF